MMRILSDTQLLKRYPVHAFCEASTFGALSTDTIRWVLEHGKLFELDNGDVLFQPGEPGDNFFVILDGSVAYYKFHDDRYAYVSDYEKGQEIGFVSMIALHARVGRAVARESSIVVQIDTPLFYRLHRESPAEFGLLMLNLARELARTIRKTDNLLVDMTTHAGAETDRD